jgi:hypothetical protein
LAVHFAMASASRWNACAAVVVTVASTAARASAAAGASGQCASALDCSLNGVCAAGLCDCDPAWTGPQCATLNLVPMDLDRVVEGAYRPGTRTSWGANVLRSDEDGLYHMCVCVNRSGQPAADLVRGVVAGASAQ